MKFCWVRLCKVGWYEKGYILKILKDERKFYNISYTRRLSKKSLHFSKVNSDVYNFNREILIL